MNITSYPGGGRAMIGIDPGMFHSPSVRQAMGLAGPGPRSAPRPAARPPSRPAPRGNQAHEINQACSEALMKLNGPREIRRALDQALGKSAR